MTTLRPSEERGHADFGWLDSRHTFSFGHYFDPGQMGFGALRVINEDRVAPGAGFETHGHRDMEIISYVIGGALRHEDTLGNGSVIRPGELQRMTAGTGIRHSEYNESRQEPVHFLQIWIVPERTGLAPGYEQKAFPGIAAGKGPQLIGSRDGRDGSVTIHQDIDLYAARLAAGEETSHAMRAGRRVWVQVVRGTLEANGQALAAGDGFGVTEEDTLRFRAAEDTEFLLFDLAG